MAQTNDDPYKAIQEKLESCPSEKKARVAWLRNLANELEIPNDLRTNASELRSIIQKYLGVKIRGLKPGMNGTYGGNTATIIKINRDCSVVIRTPSGAKKTIYSYNFITGGS
ncbi:hypothetical protein HY406_00590 [Candidatus Giovannonibacteria bacterium]|nr:hypothetical protein [Candidatus Giovannonibacteria bacterium]